MELQLIEGLSPRWYVPLRFRQLPEPEQPRFHLHPLTQEEVMDVLSHYDNDQQKLLPRAITKAVRLGVRGWENIKGKDKQDREFNLENLSKVPWQIQRELAVEVVNMSSLSEEEAKNS